VQCANFNMTVYEKDIISLKLCFRADLRSHEGHREETYRLLYDDIAANQKIWMEFFDDKLNYWHAENTCGILVRTRGF
jgi:hypothetical protein